MFMYAFASMFFSGSYVLTFVVVTILSAMDFWTVKNVSAAATGRARAWNDVDARRAGRTTGDSRAEEQRFIHLTDSSFFWAVLFAAPVVWGILGFLARSTFKFMWVLLTAVAQSPPQSTPSATLNAKRPRARSSRHLGGHWRHAQGHGDVGLQEGRRRAGRLSRMAQGPSA